MKKCVLVRVLGKQMFSTMREMEQVFDVPAVGFTLWEKAERSLGRAPGQTCPEGVDYSYPAFYRENFAVIQGYSWRELDAEQRRLEDALGVDDAFMLMSYDRGTMENHDFRTARNIQVLAMQFAEKMLSEIEPLFFWGGRASFLNNVIANALEKRGIPTFAVTTLRHDPNRLIGLDAQGRQLGMEEAFAAISGGNVNGYDPEPIAAADAWYDTYLNKPARPAYAARYSRSLGRAVKNAVGFVTKTYQERLREYEELEFDRLIGAVRSPNAAIAKWPAKFMRMMILQRTGMLDRHPDFNKKFIYLPLHFSPEVTDMYYGRDYSHHEGFVVNLAKRLPSEYCLFVKDHTSMVGLRPLNFYQHLKSLPNVEVIHPQVSTFDLMHQCEAVLAVTGTAGWEGYLLNKPVIALGKVFYNFLPGILKAKVSDPDFHRQVAQYIRNFTPDEDERKAAVRAAYASSYKVGDVYEYEDLDDTKADVREFAEVLHKLYDGFGDSLKKSGSIDG